jgi:hypothetical protein
MVPYNTPVISLPSLSTTGGTAYLILECALATNLSDADAHLTNPEHRRKLPA